MIANAMNDNEDYWRASMRQLLLVYAKSVRTRMQNLYSQLQNSQAELLEIQSQLKELDALEIEIQHVEVEEIRDLNGYTFSHLSGKNEHAETNKSESSDDHCETQSVIADCNLDDVQDEANHSQANQSCVIPSGSYANQAENDTMDIEKTELVEEVADINEPLQKPKFDKISSGTNLITNKVQRLKQMKHAEFKKKIFRGVNGDTTKETMKPTQETVLENENMEIDKSSNEDVVRVGLYNTDKTCYLNSVLQMLFSIKPLMKDLKKQFIAKDSSSNENFLTEFMNVYDRITIAKSEFKPHELKNIIDPGHKRFPLYTDHDAHELLGEVLTKLDSPPIKSIFQMHVNKKLTCVSCGESRSMVEVYNDLGLGFAVRSKSQLDVNMLLRDFFAPVSVSCRCESCDIGESVECERTIKKFPKILVLHMKRFTSRADGTCSKLTRIISIPEELDLGDFCNNSVSSKSELNSVFNDHVEVSSGKRKRSDDEHLSSDCKKVKMSTKYRLVSTVNHIGTTMTNGHYVAFQRLNDRGFVLYDDLKTSIKSVKNSLLGPNRNTGYIAAYELMDC